MMSGSSDTSWSQAQEPHERLKWARSQQFPTARAFAAAMGMGEQSYSAFEREPGRSRTNRLTADRAMQFARKLRVRWEWLLEGAGLPWLDNTDASRTRPAAQIAEIVDAQDPEEQARLLELVKIAARRTGTGG